MSRSGDMPPAGTAPWVDTHCHLYDEGLDAGDLLRRAAAAGVGWVVCPGVDAATSRQAVELADRFAGRVLAGAGLHPHYAGRWAEEREAITALVPAAAAVGECGLDYYRNLAAPTLQREAFRDQLRMAADAGKPVIVHCRDAFGDVYDLLSANAPARAVLHCWTGGPRWTKRFADLGVTFSFAGPITFPTGDTVRRAAAVAPRHRVMVETDTPYLTPPPDRAARNEPANVVRVGEALAEVWGEGAATVAAMTSRQATEVFR